MKSIDPAAVPEPDIEPEPNRVALPTLETPTLTKAELAD